MTAASSIAMQFKKILFPVGSVATIRRGPLAGCRYRISAQNASWAPIVGRWEPGAQALYTRIVGRNAVVYDLGANAGLHSLLFARLVGPQGHVYAFEPMEENRQDIASILSLNGIDNVSVVDKAVSRESGTATFSTGHHAKGGNLSDDGGMGGGEPLTVAVTALDDFVAAGGRPPDFIKCDIEGAEGPALQGARETLRAHQPILTIELHTPEQDVLVGKTLSELGYELYRFEPASRTLPRLTLVKSPRKGWPTEDGTWGTVLAVHPTRKQILSRLEIA